jgi:sugar lactone lactonase YvrE
MTSPECAALPVAPALLGESPLWHPQEQVLYWCDIPGHQLHRYDPVTGAHGQWTLPCEPACCAAVLGGGLLLGMRDGLWRFDTATGQRQRVVAAPYDSRFERFNDGKADAQGRFWVGTIHDQREPKAALYCLAGGRLQRMAGDITTSNGLGFSPDGQTLYWSDTKAHAIYAFDLDIGDGSLSRRRVFQQFESRAPGQALETYGGRPDGAAVDAEGAYWVAMYEGQRLLRFAPDGRLLSELPLPTRCPTMPCFGGADLRTLYITTARDNRPADELARQPLAGCVLQIRVPVPGLPSHMVKL